jgi:hypothetical protein
MFLAWGIPVFAIAAAVSFIDPSIAAWVNGAAADILDTEKTIENFLVTYITVCTLKPTAYIIKDSSVYIQGYYQ